MRFYVYELRDETGATFYVGKGSNRRMYEHKYKANAGQKSPRSDRIREILARGGMVIPVKVFETDDETAAFAEEIRLIAHHGRENLTNGTKGGCGIRDLSPESRAKIAASRRGRIASAETRRRQAEAKRGVPRTTETRAKIAAYQTGKEKPWAKLPRSEEYRAKMSQVQTGKTISAEARAKMSAAKMGHTVSAETRAKISATKKARAAAKAEKTTTPAA